MRRLLRPLIVLHALGLMPAVAAAGDAPAKAVVFSGSAYKEDTGFSYLGGVAAFNGDLGANGWLGRVFAGLGDYSYSLDLSPNGHVDSDFYKVDFGLGYQTFINRNLRATGYLSAEYEDHDLSFIDPANSVRGGEWGVKVRGELATTHESPFDFALLADYGSAFDTYWVDLRVGMKIHGQIAVGPEFISQGNSEYDEVYYGAYIMNVPSPLGFGTFGASVGWSDSLRSQNDSDDHDSIYGIFRSTYVY